MQKYIFKIVFLLLLAPHVSAQEWIVPADKKNRLSTFPFSDETRKAGERLFTINCMSCHGTPGKGTFLALVPPPGDPASEDFQKNNDGEIFYKVSTGRQQMPSFKSVLSSTEIWNIISFIRSFNPSYKQEVMKVVTSSAYPGAEIKIALEYNQADSTIVFTAKAITDNSTNPVTDAAVKIFVHRYFGLLQIDEEKTTDNKGSAVFIIPDKLPGDTAGSILISARFSNEELFGSVSKDTLISAAVKTIPVSLVAERAMWNNVRKAPLWVILAFSLGLLSVWGVILIVLMKLRDIFIIGETVTNSLKEKKNGI